MEIFYEKFFLGILHKIEIKSLVLNFFVNNVYINSIF